MDESPGKMYALTAVFMIIALIAVPLRFYTRRLQSMQLGLDDWLMLPALVSSAGLSMHSNKLTRAKAIYFAYWHCDYHRYAYRILDLAMPWF